MVLNLNLTIVELIKVLNTIKGLGFKRTIIYFINSTLNFRLAFKSSFEQYNKHLFFPASIKIRNVLKKFRLLYCSNEDLKANLKFNVELIKYIIVLLKPKPFIVFNTFINSTIVKFKFKT